jgi:hypothetical protein
VSKDNSTDTTGSKQEKAGQFPEICPETKKHEYLLGPTGNTEQTPIFFNKPESTTVTSAGKQTVQVRTTGAKNAAL